MSKNLKRCAVTAAFAGLLALQPFSSGGVPGCGPMLLAFASRDTAETEYDAETLAKLQDNTLEYDEIPGLIEQYNTEYRNELASFYDNPDGSVSNGGTGMTREQLLSLAAELRSEAETLDRDSEDMKDDGELDADGYEEYQDNVKALRSYAAQLEDAAAGKSAAGTSALRGLRVTRENQSRQAAAKMRTYQTLAGQAEIAAKNVEIASQTYEAAKKQQELGLYAAEDVLSAREALDSANASDASAKASLADTKRGLLTMLGWKYDADPQIMPVPEPDESRIAAMNLETDTARALETNYTLYTLHTTASSSSGGAVQKARDIKDQEDTVRQNMELLYQEVQQKQTAYGAAKLEMQNAEADKASADRKYEMGMLSRQEYLSAEVTYLSARADYDSAGLDLTEAIEDYEWAVKGVMDSSSETAG